MSKIFFKLIFLIKVVHSFVTFNDVWGSMCHVDCQCKIMTLAQTQMSRWLPGNEEVKAAFCVIQSDSNATEIFEKLPQETEALTLIQTSDSNQVEIDQRMMFHLNRLRGIDFQGSSTTKKLSFSKDAFSSSSDQLQFASFQSVHFQEFEDFPFSNLTTLECLQIVRCQMSAKLESSIFEGLHSLLELYMVQNEITSMDDFIFEKTPLLRRISLSHNQITRIESQLFSDLLELEMLDLSNNKLDHISLLTFPSLPKLRWLELKHNPLQSLLPNSFFNLNSTQHLSLGHSAQTLHLNRFSFNRLSSLINLNVPNVENNILENGMFLGLDSLIQLKLKGNIHTLGSGAFEGAHKMLRKLILNECSLKKIDEEAFSSLLNLTSLDLSLNELTNLHKFVFAPLVNLRELLLNGNKLQTLPGFVFERLSQLTTLRLDLNPWNCSCSMSTWKEDLITRIGHLTTNNCQNSVRINAICFTTFEMKFVNDPAIAPRCQTPEQFRGIDVFTVLREYFQCQ